MPDVNNSLNITLTEPIVFLRSSDPSGRLQTEPNNLAPTLVRGLLTLNVIKTIEISSIEVELVGLSTISFPTDGTGPYRADIPETQKLYSSSVTVFRASQVPRNGRPSSVGPASSALNSDDVHEHPPPSSRRGSERPSAHDIPFDFGPTPPYTLATQSPTTIESRLAIPEEHPDPTPRQVRRYNSTSLDESVAISLPHHVSSASSNINIPFDQEDENRSDEVSHMSPPSEGDVSSHSTAEDLPHILHHRTSPSRRSRVHSPGSTRPTRMHVRGSSCDDSNALASRSRLRLSLSSVLGAVAEMAVRSPSRSRLTAEEMERGRTRNRMSHKHQTRDRTLQTDEGIAGTSGNDNHLETNTSHPTEHRDHHFLGLGRFFGFEHDREKEMNSAHTLKEHGDSRREFKLGTYSYPISFLVPPDLPPSFSVPHGSMKYYIKAVAHRPGTFTSKLSCKVPVLVVTIGDGEDARTGDLGPVSIERQWEGKLAYSFEMSSRLFLLGSQRQHEVASASIHSDIQFLADSEAEMRVGLTYGTVTLDLTLLPIEKIKIWKLSAFVEQRIKYLGGGGMPLRTDDRRLVKLLEVVDECPTEEMDSVNDDEPQAHRIKHKHEHEPVQIPLLPTPLSPHRSPLLRHVSPSSDPSVLIGSGPYALSFVLGLPGCNDPSSSDNGLHFTMKQKSPRVRVEHTIKFIIRLERPGNLDDDTYNHEDKARKKYFDLSLQVPITILSCRCDPKFQTLPSYSQTVEDDLLDYTVCPCQPSAASSTGGPGHQGEREHDELESAPFQGQGQGHEHGHVPGTMPTPTSSSSSSSSFNDHSHLYFHHHRSSLDEYQRSDHPNPLTLTMSPGPPSPASWAHEFGPSTSAGPGPGPSVPGAYDDWHPPRGHQHHLHAALALNHHSLHSSSSHSHTHAPVHSHAHPHASSHPHTPHVLTPYSSRPPSPIARYERLVSGQESEGGEAPPSYESIAT